MPGIEQMLEQMAEIYRHKVPDELSLIAQIDIEPDRGSWHVLVEQGGQVTIGQGVDERAQFIRVCFK